jgi:hypothetical protein
LENLISSLKTEIETAIQGRSKEEGEKIARDLVLARITQLKEVAVKDVEAASELAANVLMNNPITEPGERLVVQTDSSDKPLPQGVLAKMQFNADAVYPILAPFALTVGLSW